MGFDTGASVSISNSLSDFVSWDDVTTIPTLHSITARPPVKGSGTVRWCFTDDNKKQYIIEFLPIMFHRIKFDCSFISCYFNTFLFKYTRQRVKNVHVDSGGTSIFYPSLEICEI